MATLDEIAEELELFDDWEQRYQYLIELGEHMPTMPEALKTEDTKVKGCMSQVWISPYRQKDDAEKIRFHGDCDTSVIKGVLAVLISLVNGKTANEIKTIDIDEIFDRLQLAEHLSPNRHVGVYGIVELMKTQAQQLEDRSRQVA
ncbi:SufE family protein [Kaarinaea lacus]